MITTRGDVYYDGCNYSGCGNTAKYSIQVLQGAKIRRDLLGEVTLVLRLEGVSQALEEAQSVPGRRTDVHKGKGCKVV